MDLLIVGGGPCGLAAGIKARQLNLDVLLLEANRPGGHLWERYAIDDYPGFPMGITGHRLAGLFITQAHQHSLKMTRELVRRLNPEGEEWVVEGARASYRARAVIVATGTKPRKLDIPGEAELLGKGVYYSTNAPGIEFSGKRVMILGGSELALDQALLLAQRAAEVSVIVPTDEIHASDRLRSRVAQSAIPIVRGLTPIQFVSEQNGVVAVVFTDSVGARFVNQADLVFVYSDREPNVDLLPDEVQTELSGDLGCRTDLPGLYIAGDVRRGVLTSVAAAVGDGVSAVLALAGDMGLL